MDPSKDQLLQRRHIQNHSAGGNLQSHWGYPDRVTPCKNDPGSCAYLDVVYDAHDVGMLYVAIIWATIGSILLLWAVLHRLRPSNSQLGAAACAQEKLGGRERLRRSFATLTRRYLLPDASHVLFGRTTRLQVAILAVLSGYLLIWTFLGMAYNTWVTPVAKMPGVYNTRTSLGPWADRVGVLAYALTPLSVLLSSRDSLLSILTGVPYQSFNFLHRWLGYIIFLQASLHTIGWCVVEIRLYQPQPAVAAAWIVQPYIVWGIVAMLLLTLLFVLSTPWAIRRTGYEFFRKAHYVLAMVYIGACWGHWEKLKCFLVPSLLLWGLDRAIRLARTAMLHYHPSSSGNRVGFRSMPASITRFPDPDHGDVLRLDMANVQDSWDVGQHFYLCFPACSIWQSHPFTPLNLSSVRNGTVRHSYILRAKSGETKKLAKLVGRQDVQDKSNDEAWLPNVTTPVILTGPYGESIMDRISGDANVMCIAGGTGITYVLPVLLQLVQQSPVADRKIELVWAMRHSENAQWVEEELTHLRKASRAFEHLEIRLFATRDAGSSPRRASWEDKQKVDIEASSSSSGGACQCDAAKVTVDPIGDGVTGQSRHPNLGQLVDDFVEATVAGPTVVFASGPGGMISDLRSIVAAHNSAKRVWRGQARFDVALVCDDRLEW